MAKLVAAMAAAAFGAVEGGKLADAATAGDLGGTLVGAISGAGFSGAICWYLLTRVIPEMNAQQAQIIREMLATFTAERRLDRDRNHDLSNQLYRVALRGRADGDEQKQ